MTARPVTADDRVRAVLHPLDGIGLDELVDSAALLTRIDRKYVLSLDDALAVLDALARTRTTRVLEIDGARSAAYESVYFDTPDLASFRLTATRRRHRFKVRTRTYLDSGQSFLEVKTRAARGTTLKQRVPHLDGPTTLGPGRTFVATSLAAEGVDGARHLALAPGLVSRYRRTTLLLPGTRGASRATVDTHLTWRLDPTTGPTPRSADVEPRTREVEPRSAHVEPWSAQIEPWSAQIEPWSDQVEPRYGEREARPRRRPDADPVENHLAGLEVPRVVIVETKGGSTPSDLDRLLWRHGHRPERISKYGTGMALLRPDLPDGPWRRVIRRHLTDLSPTPSPSGADATLAPAATDPTNPARAVGHLDDRSI